MALILLALLCQDPIEIEAKFRFLLDRTEKAGLAVPDLPDAAAELAALLPLTKDLAKDLRNRYDVVRAQAAVLSSFHAMLLKHKGGMFALPLPTGDPIQIKLVDVMKRGVRVDRQTATQDFLYSEFDPEWVLSSSCEDRDALAAGLWLAKAARWEAAFIALGALETDHPLAAEARKRGIETAAVNLDVLARGRKWAALLERLEKIEKLAPHDRRLAAIRSKTLDAMVEHGKDLCRRNSKGPMNDLIDLITKHFPEGAERIEDIREADRWVKIVDPRRFGMETTKGPPWVIDPDAKAKSGRYFQDESNSYTGLSVTFRFEKDSIADGGIGWLSGAKVAWINAGKSVLLFGQGKAGDPIHSEFDMKIPPAKRHTLSVRIRGAEYRIHYNGAEVHRCAAEDKTLVGFGLHAYEGRVWFDEVLVLKKE